MLLVELCSLLTRTASGDRSEICMDIELEYFVLFHISFQDKH
jgi:hypothetical protein